MSVRSKLGAPKNFLALIPFVGDYSPASPNLAGRIGQQFNFGDFCNRAKITRIYYGI
jgi:hypothetical protein